MTEFDGLLRIEGGRVLAGLIRFTGDIGLAEDALQDAVLTAVERWPLTGVPRNPGAWLTTVARNRALDRMRREAKRSANERAASAMVSAKSSDGAWDDGSKTVRDDQLRLLFTCCHPALAPEARIALALRTICGLTTTEIARVHLMTDPAMGQRISRAKKKIAVAGIPYRVPDDHELPDRLPTVLTTVYAIFTVGHHATNGRLDARVNLADEGVRLARLLVELMPDEPECVGLLALMLATHARRGARVDGNGDLVLMEQQDRRLWRHGEISEASTLVETVLQRRRVGPFQIQAAISCLHGLAAHASETDWPQIAELYALLETLQPSPVVRVNRAVAVAYAAGPAAGLAVLDGTRESDVAGWHLYWSTKAELSGRAGAWRSAATYFERALACEMNDTDRRFLSGRLDAARRAATETTATETAVVADG